MEEEVTAWKEKRFVTLSDPTGWLTLVGLHWLRAGKFPSLL